MIGPLAEADIATGFCSGVHPLDDYFARHALPNDRAGISRCFVLRPGSPELPAIAGFYTLSMASVQSDLIRPQLRGRLPKYPLPVALIGRLAVDERARGRRLGELLVVDALGRVVAAAESVACVGIVVDAKDEGAERFYQKYDFATVDVTSWSHRLFLPIATARAAANSGDAAAAQIPVGARVGQVAKILRKWDPIGVSPGLAAPSDEYDRYAPAIVAMVEAGASIEQVEKHLGRLCTERMGLPTTTTKDRAAAEAIFAWWGGAGPR